MEDRKILHVDVNNAFLSWTAVDLLRNGYEIDIRTIPAIIGGDEERRSGIVLAKSPVAKKFGVVTAEPIYFAKQKCPNLQVFQGNFTLYRKESNNLYNILKRYTDKIERFSIDESFMDLTNYLGSRKLIDVAYEIKDTVERELGFTVNVGVSQNKLLAKMASDFEKPNKVHTLYLDEIEDKMWPLPVSELFGVGKKTVPKLLNMRLKTIGDLAKYDEEKLIKKFGKMGKWMHDAANGIDDSEVSNKIERPKSIGNQVTQSKDLTSKDQVELVMCQIAEEVAFRLRKEKMVAEVVAVSLRTNTFKDYSHQKKIGCQTSNTKKIIECAKSILNEMEIKEPIRLVGLRVDNLSEEDNTQLSIFNEIENDEKLGKLDKVVDDLKSKFGYTSVTYGRMLGEKDEKYKIKYTNKNYKKN